MKREVEELGGSAQVIVPFGLGVASRCLLYEYLNYTGTFYILFGIHTVFPIRCFSK